MKELEQLKDFLISLLTEARELDKRVTGKGKIVLDARIRLLETITAFIIKSLQTGELDMEKAKIDIKIVEQGEIEELGRRRTPGPIVAKILELAEKVKEGKYIKVDPEGIEPKAFIQRVQNLRAAGRLPANVKPKAWVNGEFGVFLVKLTKDQMAEEPTREKRRQKVGANGN